jgi:hypothetical protein
VAFNIYEYLDRTGRFELLTQRGNEIKARCPFAAEFHKNGIDRRPSWGINATTGKWHCFSCNQGGVLRDLVSRLGLPTMLGMNTQEDRPDEWAREFVNQLREGETTVEIPVPVRHPLPGSFQKFQPSDDHPSARYVFKTIGYTWESIVHYGVGWCAHTGGIIYPIPWVDGSQISWIRRNLPGQDLDTKYIGPEEAHKSLILYGIHAVPPSGKAILVEGIKSVILLNQRLKLLAICSLGSQLLPSQLVHLAKIRDLTILLDGDEAGRQGTQKTVALLKDRFAGRLYEANLPDQGKESSPDDFADDVLIQALEQRKPVEPVAIPTEAELQEKLDFLKLHP